MTSDGFIPNLGTLTGLSSPSDDQNLAQGAAPAAMSAGNSTVAPAPNAIAPTTADQRLDQVLAEISTDTRTVAQASGALPSPPPTIAPCHKLLCHQCPLEHMIQRLVQ